MGPRIFVLALGVVVVLWIAMAVIGAPPAATKPPPQSPPAPPRVSVDLGNWFMGGFGTVMIADLVIRNGEGYAVKDVDIVCELTAKSGTVLGATANTVFQTVPAHGRLRIHEFNMGSGLLVAPGQVAWADCKVGQLSKND